METGDWSYFNNQDLLGQCNRSNRSWMYFSIGCEFFILDLIYKVNVSYWKTEVENTLIVKELQLH